MHFDSVENKLTSYSRDSVGYFPGPISPRQIPLKAEPISPKAEDKEKVYSFLRKKK